MSGNLKWKGDLMFFKGNNVICKDDGTSVTFHKRASMSIFKVKEKTNVLA